MNQGPLPPVPDLIPISALRPGPQSKHRRHCAPRREVMGEQRSRRTDRQPAADPIDTAGSRGHSGAAPQAPSRKTRSDRHRKSHRKRSASKHRSRSRAISPNPRVNPIFVWVRQEDTRIVDVKCEDYDKRNRILLTKTAQGWRAIPRTETLVPTLREAAVDRETHHRVRKSRKSSKVKRKSTAVQVDEDVHQVEAPREPSPTWTSPVNIESHLPSHTIHIPKKRSLSQEPAAPESDVSSVNSDNCSAQTQCSASKLCDVSPLDNLLAVAELEFNHQIQSGEWGKTGDGETADCTAKSYEDESKEYLDNIAQLNKLIDSCSGGHDEDGGNVQGEYCEQKIEDCDYTEEEENNLVMDDILSRLEQSLRSPEACHPEMDDAANEYDCNMDVKPDVVEKEPDSGPEEVIKDDYTPVPEPYFDQKDPEQEKVESNYEEIEQTEAVVESSTILEPSEDTPTDLTISRNTQETFITDDMVPTDLSIPKNKPVTPLRPITPRSPSQNSETIQSPQPSGIPAVPPSPEIFPGANKSKSVFLESLLSSANQKIALNSEVTLTRQKEPLDLGKCRKSASPTVTCSEEAKINSFINELEPLAKKFKIEDLTLKTLLDPELLKTTCNNNKTEVSGPTNPPATPKLLELLTSESEVDPITQLKQVLADTTLNVPDPMLVPKDRLSQLLQNPAKEIPKLLKERPELRLPEALAYPHLLQDPDILVITLAQLETIIQKQCQPISLQPNKVNEEKSKESYAESKEEAVKDTTKEVSSTKSKNTEEERPKQAPQRKESQPRASINELASDIDAATNAAFNQMMWLPYLNQLEAAASFGNNADFLKVLSSMFPVYPGQVPEVPPLFNTNRIPPPVPFPVQPQINYNPLEYSMWQEAMMQANLLRPKNPFEAFNAKNTYRDYMSKINMSANVPKKPSASSMNQKMPPPVGKINPEQSPFYMPGISGSQMHNPFMNVPSGYPPTSSSQNLQIPQYNPNLGHSKPAYARKAASTHQTMSRHHQYGKYDAATQMMKMQSAANAYQQQRQASHQLNNHRLDANGHQKHKTQPRSFPGYHQKSPPKELPRRPEGESNKHQPMDLSGCTNPGGKLKVKQHLVDQNNAPKLLKYDEAPEVGSTTASIEEMQESQKHLWHPLFGK